MNQLARNLSVTLALCAATLGAQTATPIHHVVVIFQENVSFDHYFATYPNAANPDGEPAFHPRPGTPPVNGLNGPLLSNNQNDFNPFRLTRAQAVTCDQDHNYTPEQQAFNQGLMNKFVEFTSTATSSCDDGLGSKLVMGYYDGNTVTALWNYAQHFAMSDNFYNTGFGPSTPGVLNLVAGQTHGATVVRDTGGGASDVILGTMIGDARPAFDDCSPASTTTASMTGKNVGDLLNAAGVTWGWFQGGFAPSSRNGDGTAVCATAHTNIAGASVTDYIPHHEPFQFYAQTANPHHLPPVSAAMIGKTDQANHQYDLSAFWQALHAGNLPAVTYLKAAGYQDGHAGYSDPLDEQQFLVAVLNALQQSPVWEHTAVVLTYDDSDGWYDHVMSPIVSQSNTAADALTGPGACGTAPSGAFQGRCGYGPRLPLLVISPWAKRDFVDHAVTDQSSILRFIEDNWKLGRLGNQSFDALAGSLLNLFDFTREPSENLLLLNPSTGQPTGD